MVILEIIIICSIAKLHAYAQGTVQSGGTHVAPNIVEGLKLSQYTATTLDVLKHSGIIEILEVGGKSKSRTKIRHF